MLARDKLNEARFFLHKLKATKGKGREFRYYFSAFLSAARSVTWVLQATLRSKYGQVFDDWYQPYQQSLTNDRMARIITRCRNLFQKEGNRLPVYTHTWRNPANYRQSISTTFTIDDLDNMDFHIQFDRASLPEFSVLVDSTKPLEAQLEQIDAQVRQYNLRVLPDVLPALQRLMEEVEPEILLSLADEDPVPFEEFVQGFEAYLGSLSTVVDAAALKFKETRDHALY